jgi:hypothetical protein
MGDHREKLGQARGFLKLASRDNEPTLATATWECYMGSSWAAAPGLVCWTAEAYEAAQRRREALEAERRGLVTSLISSSLRPLEARFAAPIALLGRAADALASIRADAPAAVASACAAIPSKGSGEGGGPTDVERELGTAATREELLTCLRVAGQIADASLAALGTLGSAREDGMAPAALQRAAEHATALARHATDLDAALPMAAGDSAAAPTIALSLDEPAREGAVVDLRACLRAAQTAAGAAQRGLTHVLHALPPTSRAGHLRSLRACAPPKSGRVHLPAPASPSSICA